MTMLDDEDGTVIVEGVEYVATKMKQPARCLRCKQYIRTDEEHTGNGREGTGFRWMHYPYCPDRSSEPQGLREQPQANAPTQPQTEPPACDVCGQPMPKGEEMFKFHGYSGPCPSLSATDPPAVFSRETHRSIRSWMESVTRAWDGYWRERRDHRYGRDFAAFVGERLLTDFDLRDLERPSATEPVEGGS